VRFALSSSIIFHLVCSRFDSSLLISLRLSRFIVSTAMVKLLSVDACGNYPCISESPSIARKAKVMAPKQKKDNSPIPTAASRWKQDTLTLLNATYPRHEVTPFNFEGMTIHHFFSKRIGDRNGIYLTCADIQSEAIRSCTVRPVVHWSIAKCSIRCTVLD